MLSRIAFTEILEALYPKSMAEDWDNIGFIVDSNNSQYENILLTIDVTKSVIDKAINIGATLIISHHPLFIEEITPYSKMMSDLALLNNLDIFAIHTNGDKAINGVNDSLAKILRLNNIKNFSDTNLARIGYFENPLTPLQVLNLLKSVLPITNGAIQVSGSLDTKISKVGICAGSGGGLVESARREKVDAFITSDLKHHLVLENTNLEGPIMFSIPHWASEFLWLPVLAEQLRDSFDQEINVVIYENSTDPWDLSLGSTK
jgi:dinuclear metal center YbgI/SA1388 family protein